MCSSWLNGMKMKKKCSKFSIFPTFIIRNFFLLFFAMVFFMYFSFFIWCYIFLVKKKRDFSFSFSTLAHRSGFMLFVTIFFKIRDGEQKKNGSKVSNNLRSPCSSFLFIMATEHGRFSPCGWMEKRCIQGREKFVVLFITPIVVSCEIWGEKHVCCWTKFKYLHRELK